LLVKRLPTVVIIHLHLVGVLGECSAAKLFKNRSQIAFMQINRTVICIENLKSSGIKGIQADQCFDHSQVDI
jgi:hypothetical protein